MNSIKSSQEKVPESQFYDFEYAKFIPMLEMFVICTLIKDLTILSITSNLPPHPKTNVTHWATDPQESIRETSIFSTETAGNQMCRDMYRYHRQIQRGYIKVFDNWCCGTDDVSAIFPRTITAQFRSSARITSS